MKVYKYCENNQLRKKINLVVPNFFFLGGQDEQQVLGLILLIYFKHSAAQVLD